MNINKIIIKILIVLLITNIVFLPTTYATTIDSMITSAQDFLKVGNTVSDTIDESALQNTSSFLYTTLVILGICISIIIGAVLGCQFIFGSVEGKAKASEALVPYIVGCIIIFGAFTIWSFVVNVGQTTLGGDEVEHWKENGVEHWKENGVEYWEENGSILHKSSSGKTFGGGGGKF